MVALKGRPVFVTGAGSGIGRALAREFLKEGAAVLAIDRDPAALEGLLKEAANPRLEVLAADVSEKEGYLAALEAASERLGAPAVFVNNAGIAVVGAFAETGLASFERVLSVNLGGVVTGSFFAMKKMSAAGGGTIVNVASMAGHLPAAFMASYSTSKFAVVGFTRALQAELDMSRSPVTACLVSPGFIDTPIMRQENAPFPRCLRWLVGTPETAARNIVRGVKAGKKEVYPDFGGRLLKASYRLAPGLTVRSSRVLLARSFAELAGFSPILPARPRP